MKSLGACRRRTGNHQPGGQAGVRGEEQKGCGGHRNLGLGWGRARERAQACAVPTASCAFKTSLKLGPDPFGGAAWEARLQSWREVVKGASMVGLSDELGREDRAAARGKASGDVCCFWRAGAQSGTRGAR